MRMYTSTFRGVPADKQFKLHNHNRTDCQSCVFAALCGMAALMGHPRPWLPMEWRR